MDEGWTHSECPLCGVSGRCCCHGCATHREEQLRQERDLAREEAARAWRIINGQADAALARQVRLLEEAGGTR